MPSNACFSVTSPSYGLVIVIVWETCPSRSSFSICSAVIPNRSSLLRAASRFLFRSLPTSGTNSTGGGELTAWLRSAIRYSS